MKNGGTNLWFVRGNGGVFSYKYIGGGGKYLSRGVAVCGTGF